jgi:plastocyanin
MRALGLLGLLFVAAGCAGGADPDAAQPVATTRVTLPKSYRFDPVAIVVDRGAPVTWVNEDNFTHTVKFEAGADRTVHKLGRGDSLTLRFARPGTYRYTCTLHPHDMRGKVVVR